MGEDVHDPRMNILLLAIFERNFPDRVFQVCVFAQLPYLIRVPQVSFAELESGGKWVHHSYIQTKCKIPKTRETRPIYSLHVRLPGVRCRLGKLRPTSSLVWALRVCREASCCVNFKRIHVILVHTSSIDKRPRGRRC